MDFQVSEIFEKTWMIQDYNDGDPVNTFLIEGDSRSLLIDSGYGKADILPVCRGLTSKPIACACTHGHIDHAMGARAFSERYIHSADLEVYRANERFEGLGHCEMQFLDDIKAFDLGGRLVTWRLFPGHTPGSVVFHDSLSGYVFDGDSEPERLWLFLPEASDILAYRRSLLDNISWMESIGAKGRLSGHSDLGLVQDTDLSDLLRCVDKVINQPDDFRDHVIHLDKDMDIPVRLYSYGQSSICYRQLEV